MFFFPISGRERRNGTPNRIPAPREAGCVIANQNMGEKINNYLNI
jgi:hypothetical protein